MKKGVAVIALFHILSLGWAMTSSYKIIEHKHDVVVVGAGGAGLRATFGMVEKGLKTACITKVFPTRSIR